MNYDVFLGGLVDELEKAADAPADPAPTAEDIFMAGFFSKFASEDEEGPMSSLEEAFFAGLYDELEKSAGWRDLSGAAKQRFMSRAKASIGGARQAAAKKLLATGGKTTGTGGFKSTAEGGSLRFGRIKGTDQATVGRVRTGRAKRIMGRHGLGKGKPGKGTYSIPGVGTRQIGAKKATPPVAQPKKAPAVADTGKKVSSRPMSGWGAKSWKDLQAAKKTAPPAAAQPKADPFAALGKKIRRRNELRAAARASGREDVARFRKIDAATPAKPLAKPAAPSVASAGAKIRERNIAAGRFGPGGGPAGAPAKPTGVMAGAAKGIGSTPSTGTPPSKPTGILGRAAAGAGVGAPPAAKPPGGGWGAAIPWAKRTAAKIQGRGVAA